MFNDAGENATFLIISFYSEFFVRELLVLLKKRRSAMGRKRREIFENFYDF
jgi:hypothetical protein